jgi:hypothetical protein
MRKRIARIVRASPAMAALRLARMQHIARSVGHEDWRTLIERDRDLWKERLAAADGPSVLIATSTGGHFAINVFDRVLAASLTLRGARAAFAYCDAALPACQIAEYGRVARPGSLDRRPPSSDFCGYCHEPARRTSAALGLPIHLFSRFISSDEAREARSIAERAKLDRLAEIQFHDLPVGEHARAGALRFFARADAAGEPAAEAVQRNYLEAAIRTAMAAERMMMDAGVEVVVAHHGVYVPQGVLAAVARKLGRRVVTWNPAYRRSCFILSHGDTYHHTLMDEPQESWDSTPLSAGERVRIKTYLESRAKSGANDWISFNHPARGSTEVFGALALDPSRPLIAAFTNVFWDAQLHYRSNAYSTQMDWIRDTIAWASSRPDLQLALRIHPAEETGAVPSRQRAAQEIAAAFPTLPANVRVVPASSPISSYAIAELANAALIFATKMGVELTSMGLPVIVAGEAWIRGKGLTVDPLSPTAYRMALDALPAAGRLPEPQIERALAYAHHFFFRRMIELPFLREDPGPRQMATNIGSLVELEHERHPGLDAICDGVMHGSPFLMPRAAAA